MARTKLEQNCLSTVYWKRLRRCRKVLDAWLAQRRYAITDLLLHPAVLDDVLAHFVQFCCSADFTYLRPEARGPLLAAA